MKLDSSFPDFGSNPGPGRLPLDSGRGDIEFACVCVPVASVAISSVSEFICWNLVTKTEKLPRTRPGYWKLWTGGILWNVTITWQVFDTYAKQMLTKRSKWIVPYVCQITVIRKSCIEKKGLGGRCINSDMVSRPQNSTMKQETLSEITPVRSGVTIWQPHLKSTINTRNTCEHNASSK